MRNSRAVVLAQALRKGQCALGLWEEQIAYERKHLIICWKTQGVLKQWKGFYLEWTLALGSICPSIPLSDPKLWWSDLPHPFLLRISILEAAESRQIPSVWRWGLRCLFQVWPCSPATSIWVAVHYWRDTLMLILSLHSDMKAHSAFAFICNGQIHFCLLKACPFTVMSASVCETAFHMCCIDCDIRNKWSIVIKLLLSLNHLPWKVKILSFWGKAYANAWLTDLPIYIVLFPWPIYLFSELKIIDGSPMAGFQSNAHGCKYFGRLYRRVNCNICKKLYQLSVCFCEVSHRIHAFHSKRLKPLVLWSGPLQV